MTAKQILDVEQGSAEWHEVRRGIPTVSEFSRIITPKTGALSAQAVGYIADLIVELVDGVQDATTSYWMDRGSMLEAEACYWYEFDQNVETEVVGLVLNNGCGWSPDRVIGKGALEVKCLKPSTHVRYLLAGDLPIEYKPQLHGALCVGELEWIDFLSYCPKYEPLLIRVTADEYTEKVAAAAAGFLERYEAAKAKVFTRWS